MGGCIHWLKTLHTKKIGGIIIFEDSDSDDISPSSLNTDAITITTYIGGIKIVILLVDGGSACDILPLRTFIQMGIDDDYLEQGV